MTTKKCKRCGATLQPQTSHCNVKSQSWEMCGTAWICNKDNSVDLKVLPCTEKCKQRPA